MTDPTPTPVDPARVLAVLEVLGWPDDRVDAAGDPEGYSNALTRVYWELAEDVIRAADAAWRHLMQHRGTRWEIEHPPGCTEGCAVDRAALRHAIDATVPAKPGRYEVGADLGGGFQIFDRIDLPEAPDA